MTNLPRLVSSDASPRSAKRSARQRSWHHCQQLGDLLRVAGGVGRDATAEAVDGRAKAVQLDVIDDEEPVVEVVGVGDGEALGNFGETPRRRFCFRG